MRASSRRDGGEEGRAGSVEQRGLEVDIALLVGRLKVLLATLGNDGISRDCCSSASLLRQTSAKAKAATSMSSASHMGWMRIAVTDLAKAANESQSGTSSASPSSMPPDSAARPAKGDSSSSSADMLSNARCVKP